ncbi:dienelactone hydrolase family protein [Euzebya tangerina]|uniref:alpha/beta hydrolase n=1 Tax=Euzebya tangerina TaxID=591198 RepID=UPI0013C2C5F0|nr:dienelactone hydrolase family protein [Euzebya tangerina]
MRRARSSSAEDLIRGGVALGASAVGALALRAGVRHLHQAALPSRPLPRPTGAHRVGTRTVVLDDRRRLPVQIWYPAEEADGGQRHAAAAPLFPAGRGAAKAIALSYPVPAPLLGRLAAQRGHAVADLDYRVDVRGVVVLSHGWMGFRAIHADLAEQLASEGWVVLAADHVGGALVSQYPGGAVVGLEPDLMPSAEDPGYGPGVRYLVQRFAEDITSVIGAMSVGAIDECVPVVEQVWVVGQSTGGGAAILAATRGSSIAGVIGLDPWVEPVPAAARTDLAVPLIALRSGAWIGNRNDGLLERMMADGADVRLRAIPEAGHTDLTGLGYLFPALRATPLLRCGPEVCHDNALLAFADLVGTRTGHRREETGP